LQAHGKRLNLVPEVKAAITPTEAILPLMRQNQAKKFILVARHVPERMAEKLRGNGVQFIDEAGNVFINHPPLYIFIKGNRNPAVAKIPPSAALLNKPAYGYCMLFSAIPAWKTSPIERSPRKRRWP